MDSCVKSARARGLCTKHYQRALLAGEFVPYKKDYFQTGQKVCARCQQLLPIAEFQIMKRSGREYAGYCKKCAAAKAIEFTAANRDKLNAKKRDDRLNNPDKYRDIDLRRMGLTLNDYNALLEKQGGVCAICKGISTNEVNLSVDHDHSCCPYKARSCGLCVRALLCRKCNTGLGAFNDSIELLKLAISYLEGN